MADSYFEYTLSKCKSSVIKTVCARYQLKQWLQKSVKEEWSNYGEITNDSELIYEVAELFRRGELLRCCDVNGDSRIIYDRCISSILDIRINWRNGNGLDYDNLFDALADVCWMVASVYASERGRKENVILLCNQKQINESLRDYLEFLYDAAIHEHNESVYIGEGIQAKNEHPFLRYKYEYKYAESLRYINSDLTIQELENRKQLQKGFCSRHLTLYYGLTATAALADNIRKGLV